MTNFFDGPGLFADFYNANNAETAAGLVRQRVAENFIDYAPFSGAPPDRAGFCGFIAALNRAFRQEYSVERRVVERNIYVGIWHSRATHIGELLGVPPTQRTFIVKGITAYEIVDGLITAHWEQFDLLTILSEIGLVPYLGPQVSKDNVQAKRSYSA